MMAVCLRCAQLQQRALFGPKGPLTNLNSNLIILVFWCKTAKFSIQSDVTGFVTAPFLMQKALKTATPKSSFFVSDGKLPEPPDSLVFRRNQAPVGFQPGKAGKVHSAKLVTVCHRFVTALFWAENPVPDFQRTSFFAGCSEDLPCNATAAEVLACDTAACQTCHRLCHRGNLPNAFVA